VELLSGHVWPGNVRELENVVERAIALNTTGMLMPADFGEFLTSRKKTSTMFTGDLVSLEEIERQYICHVIERCNGNMSRAAEVLQIDRRTLYRMIAPPGQEGWREAPGWWFKHRDEYGWLNARSVHRRKAMWV
jgi:DNA-binding NtrC family response regulator